MDLKLVCLSVYILEAIAVIESTITVETNKWQKLPLNDSDLVKSSKTIMFSLRTENQAMLTIRYSGVVLSFAFEATKVMMINSFENGVFGDFISMSVVNNAVHTKLWASWNNGKMKCGKGAQPDMNTLLSVDIPSYLEFGSFQYVELTSEKRSVWTIFQSGGNQTTGKPNRNFRQSVLVFKNVNIQSGMMWQQTAVNPGHCAFVCLNDNACISYTFNSMKKICRGHSEKYQTLDDVTHSPEEWSEYYTYH